MQIIDLSVAINEETPAYPGDPKVRIETTGIFEKDTYNDHKICFGIHSSGTHIDAPWHMLANGKTLDEMPLEQFIGRGVYIKVEDKTFDLQKVKQANIQMGDIALFHTGMSDIYDKDEYYSERPEMPEEIANYLVDKNIKMIGLDMCSPDREPFKIHRILLGRSILIIENLTNMDQLAGKDFTVYALPVKLQLDGAPARVIAEIKE